MTPTEIITKDIQAHGQNPAPVLRWVGANVKSKNAILLQHGDSILMVNKIKPHEAELHLFTLEKPIALMGSVKDFFDKIKKSGLKRVYGKADNQQILKLLQMAGVDVMKSDKPKYNWMTEFKG